MPYFDADAIRFHYRAAGQGVPVVMQHGLGGDVQQIQDLLPAPLPFRLLTLDCRGHGETRPLGDPARLSFAQFGDDLLALLDNLGIEQAVVGGISMGAGVALNLALRYPQRTRALMLVRPAWLDAPLPANLQVYPRIAALIRRDGAGPGGAAFQQSEEYREMARTHPQAAAVLLKQFERSRAQETVDILERMPHDAPNRDRAAWARIAVPTLVLASHQDPIHPFAYGVMLAQAIPGATLIEITSKEVDAQQQAREIRQAVERFVAALP